MCSRWMYPTTEVAVSADEQLYLMNFGVVKGLPTEMDLRWDMSIMWFVETADTHHASTAVLLINFGQLQAVWQYM